VTGSHLDTVPSGGAYDGALGVVSGLVAVAALQERGGRPRRPVAVVAFTDEEGGRFNTPCLGSRLLTGALDPGEMLDRTDPDGVRLGDAVSAAGFDAGGFGPDPQRLARVRAVVELHIEQGRGLAALDTPLAVAGGVWPHGRWRLEVAGETNHAGTTRLADRRDPVLVVGTAIQEARRRAADVGGVATVGRLEVSPNASNAIAGRAVLWLDARAPDDETLDRLVGGWRQAVTAAAADQRCEATVTGESRTAAAAFDERLTAQLVDRLAHAGIEAPTLDTAAGHDAGILAAHVPTAMLFVRNPTGTSHTPAEHATPEDCLTGVGALAAALAELACR
jgi:beta-ureidopropionase / N-carbamoyl-L-amino-acid hydrolase